MTRAGIAALSIAFSGVASGQQQRPPLSATSMKGPFKTLAAYCSQQCRDSADWGACYTEGGQPCMGSADWAACNMRGGSRPAWTHPAIHKVQIFESACEDRRVQVGVRTNKGWFVSQQLMQVLPYNTKHCSAPTVSRVSKTVKLADKTPVVFLRVWTVSEVGCAPDEGAVALLSVGQSGVPSALVLTDRDNAVEEQDNEICADIRIWQGKISLTKSCSRVPKGLPPFGLYDVKFP